MLSNQAVLKILEMIVSGANIGSFVTDGEVSIDKWRIWRSMKSSDRATKSRGVDPHIEITVSWPDPGNRHQAEYIDPRIETSLRVAIEAFFTAYKLGGKSE